MQEEVPDRRLSKRERLRLAGALVVLLGVMAACDACAAPFSERRSAHDQYDATVSINRMCTGFDAHGAKVVRYAGGSGVVISPHMALTARHVVVCPAGFTLTALQADQLDGSGALPVRVDFLPTDENEDVARVELTSGSFSWARSISIGPRPQVGDWGCESAAYPRQTYRCGTVDPSPDAGLFYVDMVVEHGNSGSGFWVRGQLVGLTVQADACEYLAPCVGGIMPLQGYASLIPGR